MSEQLQKMAQLAMEAATGDMEKQAAMPTMAEIKEYLSAMGSKVKGAPAAAKGFASSAGTAAKDFGANAYSGVKDLPKSRVLKGTAIAAGAALAAGGAYAAMKNRPSAEEIGQAKAAAAELYQSASQAAEEALAKVAYAEALWQECDDEFVKLASDNGSGEVYGPGDQMTSVGGVAPVPDNQPAATGAMSPGALNSFIEMFRKRRAVNASGAGQ